MSGRISLALLTILWLCNPACTQPDLNNTLYEECVLGVSPYAVSCASQTWYIRQRVAKCYLVAEAGVNQTSPEPLRVVAPHVTFAEQLVNASLRFTTGAELPPVGWALPDPTEVGAVQIADLDGPRAYHAYVMPSNSIGDLVGFYDMIQDLSPLVLQDKLLDWSGFLPLYKDALSVYDGRIFAIPTQGMMMQLYYRRDLLEQTGQRPPASWAEVISVAREFNGTDLNGDDQPDYGICMWSEACDGVSTALVAILASLVQSKGRHTGLFFEPDTLRCAADSVAWDMAMEIARNLTLLAAPVSTERPSWNNPCFSQPLFSQGRCALALAAAGQFKSDSSPNNSLSVVRGKIGSALLPGSEVVLDWQSNSMVRCTPHICPYATQHTPLSASVSSSGQGSEDTTDKSPPVLTQSRRRRQRRLLAQGPEAQAAQQPSGQAPSAIPAVEPIWVNRAPYTQSGGMSIFISNVKPMPQRLATYELAVQMVRDDGSWPLVLSPGSEFGPTRAEHLDAASITRWMDYGYHPDDLASFLEASRASLSSGNVAMDLRSEGSFAWKLLMLNVSRLAYNTSMPLPDAVRASRDLVDRVVDEAFMAALRATYKASISFRQGASSEADDGGGGSPPGGATRGKGAPPGRPQDVMLTVVLPVALLAGVAALAVSGTFVVWNIGQILALRERGAARITAPGLGPGTTICITDIEGSTRLWETLPEAVMSRAVQLHHDCIRRCATAHRGYESAWEGDSYILSFHGPQEALMFSLEVQVRLLQLPWPEELLQVDLCRPLYISDAGAAAATSDAAEPSASTCASLARHLGPNAAGAIAGADGAASRPASANILTMSSPQTAASPSFKRRQLRQFSFAARRLSALARSSRTAQDPAPRVAGARNANVREGSGHNPSVRGGGAYTPATAGGFRFSISDIAAMRFALPSPDADGAAALSGAGTGGPPSGGGSAAYLLARLHTNMKSQSRPASFDFRWPPAATAYDGSFGIKSGFATCSGSAANALGLRHGSIIAAVSGDPASGAGGEDAGRAGAAAAGAAAGGTSVLGEEGPGVTGRDCSTTAASQASPSVRSVRSRAAALSVLMSSVRRGLRSALSTSGMERLDRKAIAGRSKTGLGLDGPAGRPSITTVRDLYLGDFSLVMAPVSAVALGGPLESLPDISSPSSSSSSSPSSQSPSAPPSPMPSASTSRSRSLSPPPSVSVFPAPPALPVSEVASGPGDLVGAQGSAAVGHAAGVAVAKAQSEVQTALDWRALVGEGALPGALRGWQPQSSSRLQATSLDGKGRLRAPPPVAAAAAAAEGAGAGAESEQQEGAAALAAELAADALESPWENVSGSYPRVRATELPLYRTALAGATAAAEPSACRREHSVTRTVRFAMARTDRSLAASAAGPSAAGGGSCPPPQPGEEFSRFKDVTQPGLNSRVQVSGFAALGRGGAAAGAPRDLPSQRLLLRGLRVRIGCHSGVHVRSDVTFNRSMARVTFAGMPMAKARAVANAARGGMVLVSAATHALLLKSAAAANQPFLTLQAKPRGGGGGAAGAAGAAPRCSVLFWHAGMHNLDDHLLQPMEIYMAATPSLAPRWALLGEPGPLETVRTITRGVLAAPVGHVCLAAVTVAGAASIASWNLGVWHESAAMLWREAARLCREEGGFLATTLASLIARSSSGGPARQQRRRDGGCPGAGGAACGAALPLLTAAFPTAAGAVRWSAKLIAWGLLARWPYALLLHEMAEEQLWLPGRADFQARHGSAFLGHSRLTASAEAPIAAAVPAQPSAHLGVSSGGVRPRSRAVPVYGGADGPDNLAAGQLALPPEAQLEDPEPIAPLSRLGSSCLRGRGALGGPAKQQGLSRHSRVKAVALEGALQGSQGNSGAWDSRRSGGPRRVSVSSMASEVAAGSWLRGGSYSHLGRGLAAVRSSPQWPELSHSSPVALPDSPRAPAAGSAKAAAAGKAVAAAPQPLAKPAADAGQGDGPGGITSLAPGGPIQAVPVGRGAWPVPPSGPTEGPTARLGCAGPGLGGEGAQASPRSGLNTAVQLEHLTLSYAESSTGISLPLRLPPREELRLPGHDAQLPQVCHLSSGALREALALGLHVEVLRGGLRGVGLQPHPVAEAAVVGPPGAEAGSPRDSAKASTGFGGSGSGPLSGPDRSTLDSAHASAECKKMEKAVVGADGSPGPCPADSGEQPAVAVGDLQRRAEGAIAERSRRRLHGIAVRPTSLEFSQQLGPHLTASAAVRILAERRMSPTTSESTDRRSTRCGLSSRLSAPLPETVLDNVISRGLRLRAGVATGEAAVEVNCLTGEARYTGHSADLAVSLAERAPLSHVLVSSLALPPGSSLAASGVLAGLHPSVSARVKVEHDC